MSSLKYNLIIDPSFSYGNIGWVREDTADVSWRSGNLDVTIVSPWCTPLILDEEEFLSVLGTVSDSKDTVIEIGSASSGNNTRSVLLESGLIGFNSNRDWTLSDGVLKGSNTVLWNILISGDWTNTIRSRVLASTVSSCVWVVSSSLKWMLFSIHESVVHQTTIATMAVGIAIDKLLLGEDLKWVSSNSSSRWDTSSGREGPASTALSLVLNWGNFTSGNPIDTVGGWGRSEKGSVGGTSSRS